MKKIKLNHGKYALVDDEDFEYVNQWRWFITLNGYAARHPKGMVYMHSLLNKTPKGFHTDHINRNKLDNRRVNLRTTTSSQNLHNSKKYTNNTSGHRGVYWYERYKKWEVYINIKGKRIYLGRFPGIRSAIVARKNAEKLYI